MSDLQFGFVPSEVVKDLSSIGNWKARQDAIEKLEQLLRGQRDAALLTPALPGFLEFIVSLQADANFKISLAATNMLGEVIGLVGFGIKPHLRVVCDGLVEKLSDTKIIVRQANMRVTLRLMRTLRPRLVLEQFMTSLANATSNRTKEEIVNTVIVALLTFDKNDFTFPPLVRSLLGLISNEAGRVRSVAIEAMAVVNAVMDSHLGGLLSSAGASESVRRELDQRFQAGNLPTVNAEGLVEIAPQGGLVIKRHSTGTEVGGEEAIRVLGRSNSGQLPFDVPAPRARPVSSGRRTRGAVSMGSEGELLGRSLAEQDTIAYRRMQKQMPSLEVEYESRMSSADASPMGAPLSAPSNGSGSGLMTPQFGHGGAPLSARAGHPAGRSVLGQSLSVNSPKRISGGLQYKTSDGAVADPRRRSHGSGSSTSSRDSNNALEECASPTALRTMMAREGALPPTHAPPPPPSAARRRHPSSDHDAEGGVNLWLPTHGRGGSEPHTIAGERLTSATLSPAASRNGLAPQKFHRSWGPGTELPSPSRDGNAAAPDTPSGLSRSIPSALAKLKMSRQGQRRPVQSANAAINVEDGLGDGRRPPPLHTGRDEGGDPFPTAEQQHSRGHAMWNNSLDEIATPASGRAAAHTGFRDSNEAATPLGSGSGRGVRPLRPAARSSNDDVEGDEGAGSRQRAATASAMEKSRCMVEELDTAQLQPMPNAATAFPKVLQSLTKANNAKRKELDWIAQYDAVTDARRLVVHHRDIISGNLHSFVLAALPAVEELRSLTAKNALMLWQEAFRSLGRTLDTELETIAPVLVKKAGEVSNAGRETFLAMEAYRALTLMVSHCADSRVMLALVSCAGHNSKACRAKVAAAIDELVRSATSPSSTTLERSFMAGVGFLEDAAADTRTYGKRILWAVHQRAGDWEGLLRKVTSDAKLSKVRDVVGKGTEPAPPARGGPAAAARRGLTPSSPKTPVGAGGRAVGPFSAPASPDKASHIARSHSTGLPPGHPPANGNPRSRGRSPTASRLGGRKPVSAESREEVRVVDGATEAALGAATRQLDSKDWRERSAGLRALGDLKTVLHTLPESQVALLLDSITNRLSDGNSKVNVLALETVESILPSLGNALGVGLNTLIPALSANAASTNEKIRSKAVDAMDALVASVDGALLVQNLSHVISHGSARSKAVMIERLEAVVRNCYAAQPRLVGKHALGAALASLMDPKADIRAANSKLLRSLYAAMGPQLLDAASGLAPNMYARLESIVR